MSSHFVRLSSIWLLMLAVSFASVAVAASDDASRFVTQIGDKALAVISNKSLKETEKRSRLEALFTDNVDIDWIGKFVLGKNWREATPDQQSRYLKAYRGFLVKNYTGRFNEYSNEKFHITDVRDDGDGKYYLTMEIVRPGKETILVDYRVRRSPQNQYKIFDIIVEGVSLVATQRSEFTSVVSRNGLDYLIDQLANRSSELYKETQNAGRKS